MLFCNFYDDRFVRTSESFVVQLCTLSLFLTNKPHHHLQRSLVQSIPHSESHPSLNNTISECCHNRNYDNNAKNNADTTLTVDKSVGTLL